MSLRKARQGIPIERLESADEEAATKVNYFASIDSSSEALSIYIQAVGPDHASLINAICRLVARVPRNLHGIVLNHVLLDNGVTIAQGGGLLDGTRIEVGLGDEAVVAWDVCSRLCRAHCQFVMLVPLRF